MKDNNPFSESTFRNFVDHSTKEPYIDHDHDQEFSKLGYLVFRSFVQPDDDKFSERPERKLSLGKANLDRYLDHPNYPYDPALMQHNAGPRLNTRSLRAKNNHLRKQPAVKPRLIIEDRGFRSRPNQINIPGGNVSMPGYDRIDQLDTSNSYLGDFGVHHDGPFEPCCKHRNLDISTSPVAAFSENSEANSLSALIPKDKSEEDLASENVVWEGANNNTYGSPSYVEQDSSHSNNQESESLLSNNDGRQQSENHLQRKASFLDRLRHNCKKKLSSGGTK
ncbi:pal1 family early clathrin mediated endocytosis factor, meiosis specific Pal2 [Schizosaccharomyces osmophilus]|uniref:Pal1 family early clathrin mediated endocytosis factor, meiosis specific Pal2 n=1 Tax=Schizosaccharomyces osmophilus TaxID=2545709 RepID=A0AAE9WA81_9SCHI|nr:pal1 family early clathrin mediated endocytosis factor, meiosis specific Pal2 [Schizosaccharomyces osmophilus]WBW72607.1 pal1 family early clathrin mediated endocytosis factor, meiosis specific Pal2 [Schizosaccharomyces osmophilus]